MGFHIVKRDKCPLWMTCALYLGAVLAAIGLGGCLIIFFDVYPF